MRKIAYLLAVVLFSLATVSAGTPPLVTAQKAARIADDYLRERGLLASTYIAGIALEQASLFKKDKHWVVSWDEPRQIEGEDKVETGLKITMDGKLTRLVRSGR